MINSSIAFSNKRSIKVILLALLSMLFFSGMALAADDNDEKGWFIPKGTPAKNFYWGAGIGIANSDAPDANQDGSVSGLSLIHI